MTRSLYDVSGTRAVAAHHIGTAHTGDVIGLPAEILTAARDVSAPASLTNLPPSPLCLGRDDDLVWLRTRLATESGTAITQASTVQGLGGVGKSTLSLAYAHRYRTTYTLVWWITADSPTCIEQSLADLALRLIPSWAGTAAQDQRVQWAMTWLQWHPGWLLVFDNVENPADLTSYLGALNGGHHLISSRRAAGWPRTISTYPLGNLTPGEATELICSYAFTDGKPTLRELQDARALAVDLGYLPLALEQAGAYLRQNPTISIDAYRRRLPDKLDKAAEGINAERTVAHVWTQTLQALDARNPHAVTVLRTLAWLAPDDIPITILETLDDDSDSLHEALGLLGAYSMATVTRHTVSVHRLLQAVLRSTAPTEAEASPAGRHTAEKALAQAIDLPEDLLPAALDALMPHLIALATTRPAGHNSDYESTLYNRAADHLFQQDHPARAVPLLRVVLAEHERVLGDNHPDTLTGRNNLAYSYESAGDFDRAIPLYETTLAQSERVQGDTHPDTLGCRNNLAGAYASAGDFDRAIPLLESTLAQCKRVLGDNHLQTLTGRNNLAHAFDAAGDFDRAIPLYETTLAQSERVLGDTHPRTLASSNNLASAYASAGDLDRAIPLYETTLAQSERVLGDTHPDTLRNRNNLASALEGAGDRDRAISLYEKTLAQCERVLGEDHPHTLGGRNNLAYAYASVGDLDRAILLYETTLAQCERVLGDNHPQTLTLRNNLAFAYGSAGGLDRAIPLLESTLAQCERALGVTHPDTLSSRNNLASAYASAGDLDRAIPLYETALAQSERVLGDTHPQTLASRNNLAAAIRDRDRRR
ncbi:tetratricopeptide repeat protein [Kitasatospora sp. NPDC087314]|uniref:tetratricopeptide repeat protein n=1 Tax=Kitasatospora sp. NPDC087314 TaxID=3364068 RepID=UPI003801FCA8